MPLFSHTVYKVGPILSGPCGPVLDERPPLQDQIQELEQACVMFA